MALQLTPEPSRDRRPMYSEDAEQAVLGAMLLDAAAIVSALGSVDSEMFYLERHRHVFRAIATLHGAGAALDPLTLANELERQGTLHAAGGKDYIGTLLDVVPTAANVEYHVRIVREKAARRRIIQWCTGAAAEAEAGHMAPAAIARTIRHALEPVERSQLGGGALFTLYSDAEIDGLPEPEPLIEGVAFANTIVALIGAYGTLKTFLLLDMMLSIATGTDWHGHRVRQGAVVYVFAEGSSGIARRVAAWKAAHAYAGGAPIYFLTTAVKVTAPEQVAKLLASIAALDVAPIAIVLDTVARNMNGSENDAEDMGKFVDGCDTIREALQATVWAVHHTGWSAERSRGSSALPGAVHTEMILERDDLNVTLRCTKQKDAAEFEPIRLSAFPIGESLAFRALAPTSTELTRNESTACHALLANDGLSSTAWEEASALKSRSFQNARKRLVEIGYAKRTNKIYVATGAMRTALGANCQAGAKQVQDSGTPKVLLSRVSLDTTLAPVLASDPTDGAVDRESSAGPETIALHRVSEGMCPNCARP